MRQQEEWITMWNTQVAPKASAPGVWRRKEGGFLVRGRVNDPKTGRRKQVVKVLPDLREPEEAKLWLKSELSRIKEGVGPASTAEPVRFANFAASLLATKIERREICSSKTEEKWISTLRHLFGLKDDEGTIDPGVYGLGDIFVNRMTRDDVERWRDSFQSRIRAKEYAPTTINGWLSILRVITGQMKRIYGLRFDPCEDVENVSIKGHRTYTFEQPNSLDLEELSRWLEIAWARYPQHFAVILLGSMTGLRPSSLYALRRRGPESDIKWNEGLLLVRRSRGVGQRVMDMTKTAHDQVIKLPDFVLEVLRWHVDKQLFTREMEDSDLLFPSEAGRYRSNSALTKPFDCIAKEMGLTKRITPRSMRRTFQDAMRDAQVANVIVRSISGHLTEQMQQRYSTAKGSEQEQAIAKVVELTGLRDKRANARLARGAGGTASGTTGRDSNEKAG
jgi:integrase